MNQTDASAAPNLLPRLSEIGSKGFETLFHASGQSWGLQDLILCLPRVPTLILKCP